MKHLADISIFGKPFTALLLTLLACTLNQQSHGDQISALGRIQPTHGVIDVFGPSGSRVETVHVQQGQVLKKDDLIATLEGSDDAQKAIDHAESNLAHAKTMLTLELKLQDVIITGLEATAEAAATKLASMKSNADIIAPDVMEEQKTAVRLARNSLDQARVTRVVMETQLQQNVKTMEHALTEAEAKLEELSILAPADGKVLIVRQFPGSLLGGKELVKIADTSQMSVSAEVYESDIRHVEVGQEVTISSVALPHPIKGAVTQKGHMIFRQSVDSLDPRALTNSRVVEAIIELEDDSAAGDFIYLQVDVEINI